MKRKYNKSAIIVASTLFLAAIMWIAPFTGFAAIPLHLNAPLNFETGQYPTQVLPMDLDGDGDQDVAVKGVSAPTLVHYLQMFENSGDGKLIFHKVIQQLPPATQIVQADINRDGRMDLLGAYHGNQGGELLTLTQTESFSFSQDVQSLPFFGSTMCVGDLDGVNGPDLVIGDDANPVVHIYLNDGAGSFSLHGSYNTEATFRDVDGDGVDDEQVPVYPSSCKCGDLDGDGDEDLIILNIIKRTLTTLPFAKSWTEDIVALLNRGDGTFGSFQTHILWDPIDIKREPPDFTDPIKERLGIEDLDNDGDLDVVATVLRHSAILIRNENNGGFAEHEPIYGFISGNAEIDGVKLCMGGVKLCDVDSDGDLDLGINLMFADGVTPDPTTPPDDHPTDFWALFLNSGNAIFSDPIGYRTGADLHDLAFADLNGDNRPDALTVASDDKRLSVYYNEAGRYPRPVWIPLSGSGFAQGNIPKDIASGDFNDDGWMDLAVISRGIWGNNTLSVFNGGTNGISTTPFHVQGINLEPLRILADQLAANPNTDIAYIHGQSMPSAGGLNVILDGRWAEGNSITLNGRPYDLAAVDMNSDDILDLAVLASFPTSAYLILYPLAADGSLGPYYAKYIPLGGTTTLPKCLTSADMNNDGLDDLVVFKYDFSNGSAEIDVFINQGEFSFSRVPQVVFLPWASSLNIYETDVTAADVTGDGLPDLIVTYLPSNQQDRGAVRIYPNIGGGYLPYYEAYSYYLGSGMGPFRVAAAQMDNANGLDLVVSNDDANELTILFNDGYGGFLYQESYMSWGGTDALTVADFDQDGDNDVALCHHDHFMCSGHTGSVSILFNRAISPELPAPDLDGDGDVDGSDLSVFADAYAIGDSLADLNNDGNVDTEDLATFAADFGRTDCP